jgi:hypothetical protein
MNAASIYGISPAHQLEVETLRDQRDLYRSLLLSEPVALAAGMSCALAGVEQLRKLLREPARRFTARSSACSVNSTPWPTRCCPCTCQRSAAASRMRSPR